MCSAVAHQPHAEELMKAISGRKAVISPLLKGSLLRDMLMWEKEWCLLHDCDYFHIVWLLYWNSRVVLWDLFQRVGQLGGWQKEKPGYWAVIHYERLIIIRTDHLPEYNYISLSSVYLKYSKDCWSYVALRKTASSGVKGKGSSSSAPGYLHSRSAATLYFLS